MCTNADFASRFRCDGVTCDTDFHCDSRNCAKGVCEASYTALITLLVVLGLLIALSVVILCICRRKKYGCWWKAKIEEPQSN